MMSLLLLPLLPLLYPDIPAAPVTHDVLTPAASAALLFSDILAAPVTHDVLTPAASAAPVIP